MKAKDATRSTALRMLKTALTNKSIEKGRALDAAEELQVVAALVKQRRDSIEQFEAAGRHELAAKEQAEIAVLETLPAAGGERRRDRGGRRPRPWPPPARHRAKDMGKVMKAVMAALAGKTVDGRRVNELVRARLGRSVGRQTFRPVPSSIAVKGLVSLSPSSSGSRRKAGARFFCRVRGPDSVRFRIRAACYASGGRVESGADRFVPA